MAAAVALAITSLADALVAGIPSLFGAVAQAFLRTAPGVVAQAAIQVLGQADKPALRIGTLVIAGLLGAAAGRRAERRPWVGDVTFAAFGLLGVACVAWLGNGSVAGAAFSAAVAAAAGALTLRLLLRAPERVPEPAAAPPPLPIRRPGQSVDRRRFLAAGGLVAAAVAGARVTSGPSAADTAAAQARAAAFGPPLARRGLAVDGLSPLLTPNRDFYRTDEALILPSVDVSRWRLKVDGLVQRPFVLTYDELVALPLVEADITMACVSNEVGGGLVGNAHWTGVRLDSLLERAGVEAQADQIVGRSVDGFSAGFPTTVLDGRDALVAVAMNGEPLSRLHGFPARLVVPGLYGYVSATKWLERIQLTTFEAFDAYWVQRGWARLGPVKLESRIDVPRSGSVVAAGRRAVAGVAWAPTRGIARVEVRVDRGAWQEAELGPSLGDDSWRQWKYAWTATEGDHELAVRAVTTDGEIQTADRTDSFPDGATGHHAVRVRVD